MKSCSKTKNVNPVNLLCPTCEKSVLESQRRTDNQDRQTHARSQAHDQGRDLDISLSPTPQHSSQQAAPVYGSAAAASGSSVPPSMRPPAPNLMNFPNLSSSTNSAPTPSMPNLPSMDIPSLQNSYTEMVNSGYQPKILTDMFAMMLNVVSKQTENDDIKEEVKSNTSRIQDLEAKVGGKDEISEKLGLVVRNLPLPKTGTSELENVREALNEVKAPGVNVVRDVLKAYRVGAKDDYLGTVKVEMRNDECRAAIMKNKKFLANHHNNTMKNLYIKNLLTQEQMTIQNFSRDLLKMVPGGNDVFMAANGHLRQKTQQHFQPRQTYLPRQPHSGHQAPPQIVPQPRGPRPVLAATGHPPRQQLNQEQYQQVPSQIQNQAPLYPPLNQFNQHPPNQYNQALPNQYNQPILSQYNQPTPNQYNQPTLNQYNQAPLAPMYHINVPTTTTTQLQPNPLDMLDPFRSPPVPSLLALPSQEQQQQQQPAHGVPQDGPGGAPGSDSDQ